MGAMLRSVLTVAALLVTELVLGSDDAEACYQKGSICDAFINLDDQCSEEEGSYDYSAWIRCICGSGFVPVSKA